MGWFHFRIVDCEGTKIYDSVYLALWWSYEKALKSVLSDLKITCDGMNGVSVLYEDTNGFRKVG